MTILHWDGKRYIQGCKPYDDLMLSSIPVVFCLMLKRKMAAAFCVCKTLAGLSKKGDGALCTPSAKPSRLVLRPLPYRPCRSHGSVGF
jgi:hypothetical protein